MRFLSLRSPFPALVCFAGICTAVSSAAHADTVTFNSTLTAGGPTFNRPFSNGAAPPVTVVNEPFYYSVQQFFVSAVGTYTIQTTTANLTNSNGNPLDTHLELYQGSFNPSTPLANALISDDDSGGSGLSLFTITLNPGVQYLTVPTSYAGLATGTITTQISGPGTITLVTTAPEPGSMALLVPCLGILGTAGVGIRRQRKRVAAK
jgi:hypothetical protein